MFPYKVKILTKSRPYVTWAIIAINIAVFALTVGPDWMIRKDIIFRYGFLRAPDGLIRMVVSIFLHGNPMHLLGNMYFLYLFGPAVEDRLGKLSYSIAYLGCGFAGSLLQGIMSGAPQIPSIGASGAVMGVLGAFWYLFPHSPVCIWCRWGFYFRTYEMDSLWFILLYFAGDLGFALLNARDGVAHFAHVGGVLFGVLLCVALRLQRESEELAEAKAMQVDGHLLEGMSMAQLEPLLEQSPTDPDTFRAFLCAAKKDGHPDKISGALRPYAQQFLQSCPKTVAMALLEMGADKDCLTPVQYLALATRLETACDRRSETQVLQLLLNAWPDMPEAETALLRLAKLYMEVWKDSQAAQMYLTKQLQMFPNGNLAEFAHRLQALLPASPAMQEN